MTITTAEKIKLLLSRRNMTITELPKQLEQSRQNITNKLSRNNFSENDLSLIAQALNCEFNTVFKMNDTGETI